VTDLGQECSRAVAQVLAAPGALVVLLAVAPEGALHHALLAAHSVSVDERRVGLVLAAGGTSAALTGSGRGWLLLLAGGGSRLFELHLQRTAPAGPDVVAELVAVSVSGRSQDGVTVVPPQFTARPGVDVAAAEHWEGQRARLEGFLCT
jgi:hypothetical protein